MLDDERAIRELVKTWLDASKAGDIATVLDLMTDDAIFMVPGQKPFGKEAFASISEGMTPGLPHRFLTPAICALFCVMAKPLAVMAGLDPAIQRQRMRFFAWITGSRPVMTS